MSKEVEIFYGDIGTVRNELNSFMKKVANIISLTQSVSVTSHQATPFLTVVLVYVPWVECPEEYKYNPNPKRENYI